MLGNACRELRRTDESVAYLRDAVAAAEALGDDRLDGLATMSLAATLSYTGDFEASLQCAGRAVELLADDDRVVALGQQAGLLARSGRHGEALEAFTVALEAASNSIDELVCGELWMNRGVLYGWAGEIEAAEHDTRNGLDVFERLGHTKRAADLRHNLAWLAGRRGDLVEAFRRFDEAERQYEQLGLTSAAIFPDRSEVLLAAGLSREALALAERAVDDLRRQPVTTSTSPRHRCSSPGRPCWSAIRSGRPTPVIWRRSCSPARAAAAGGRPPHRCTSNRGCAPGSPTIRTCGGSTT